MNAAYFRKKLRGEQTMTLIEDRTLCAQTEICTSFLY